MILIFSRPKKDLLKLLTSTFLLRRPLHRPTNAPYLTGNYADGIPKDEAAAEMVLGNRLLVGGNLNNVVSLSIVNLVCTKRCYRVVFMKELNEGVYKAANAITSSRCLSSLVSDHRRTSAMSGNSMRLSPEC
ncbi:hypothetical protein Salat_1077700 [Sesamum alatum]|uniref:Uncharacterized protein n=1 Tax=Sesamum alatum TaxID=300844 RepID=A0AAE1YMI9_9LAMI|nr:hypothetical protein Salat_1077700 [Sesamum alatum]